MCVCVYGCSICHHQKLTRLWWSSWNMTKKENENVSISNTATSASLKKVWHTFRNMLIYRPMVSLGHDRRKNMTFIHNKNKRRLLALTPHVGIQWHGVWKRTTELTTASSAPGAVVMVRTREKLDHPVLSMVATSTISIIVPLTTTPKMPMVIYFSGTRKSVKIHCNQHEELDG